MRNFTVICMKKKEKEVEEDQWMRKLGVTSGEEKEDKD